jgi:hypothetical protein
MFQLSTKHTTIVLYFLGDDVCEMKLHRQVIDADVKHDILLLARHHLIH